MAFSAAGKERRLARLFPHPDHRTLILPIDDGLIAGPHGALADLSRFFRDILPCPPDGILLFPGILVRCHSLVPSLAAIVNLTASTQYTCHTQKILCTDVATAVASGADLVAVHVNVTSRYEPDMLQILGAAIRRADNLGVPVLAIMYPRGETNGRANDYSELRHSAPDRYTDLVVHAARIAMELGADVIKTQYTGSPETFQRVVQAVSPVPVVTAGGPLASERHVLTAARDAIAAGAHGVSFGRNVFQHPDPSRILRLLHAVVHGDPMSDSAAHASLPGHCAPEHPGR